MGKCRLAFSQSGQATGWGFPSGSAVKSLHAKQEPQEKGVWLLGLEEPLAEGIDNSLQYS